MGGKFGVGILILYLVSSGAGAIIDGSLLAGLGQFAAVIPIFMFIRWRRRRAESRRMYYPLLQQRGMYHRSRR